jgi:PAS domain S-box-containing protein
MLKKISPEILDLINSKSDSLYEDAPCGFIFTDPNGYFLKVNRTFLEWTGYSGQEILQIKRFQDLLTVGSKIYYETNFGPLLRMQGFVNEVAMEVVSKSEEKMHVLISINEVRDEAGTPLFLKASIFNISDRKKYERELLFSRERAERAHQRLDLLARAGEQLKVASDYVSCFEIVTKLVTEKFVDLCSIDLYEDGSYLRLAQSSHYSQKSIPLYSDLNASLFSKTIYIQDTEIIDETFHFLKPVINELEAESVIIVPILKREKQFGIVSFYVTEFGRKSSQEDLDLCLDLVFKLSQTIENIELHEEKEKSIHELRESHEWFSTTLRSIGDAVLVVRDDLTIDFLNPVAERLTLWTQEEAFGKKIHDVFSIIDSVTGEKAFNPVEAALTKGMVQLLAKNTALVRKDGSQIVIEDSASPIIDDNGKIRGVVLVFRDVTEEHKDEIAKNSLLKNLRSEKEIREKFVDTLTHDLRSPLSALKMNVQLIQRKQTDSQQVATLSTRAINNINRVDRMIQDLLDANRLRAGEIIFMEMDRFNFVDLIHETISDLLLIHGDRFYADTPVALNGFWNREGLRRIIENLCNNAVKYGSKDSPIMLTLKHQENYAVFSVHNEGEPIPQNEQAFLFDPYVRSESAKKGEQKGWGLGLTLVKGVTEGHQGHIKVVSAKNIGTTFEIYLPVDARKYLE